MIEITSSTGRVYEIDWMGCPPTRVPTGVVVRDDNTHHMSAVWYLAGHSHAAEEQGKRAYWVRGPGMAKDGRGVSYATEEALWRGILRRIG